MEKQLQEVRDQQKASWNKFSGGWKKWDELMMKFMAPFANEMIRLINPVAGEQVLDIATGTGEPGLTIATLVAPAGKVVLTDLAESMLVVAKENAEKRGIHNIKTVACDVSELPFADNSFDAISCRFGFMFFPDMALAAKEMARVLKPGGRIATSVWNIAQKNFWVTAMGGTINRNMNLPAPAPEGPGMFRCAAPDLIEGIFRDAGLINTSENEIFSVLPAGTAEQYWNMMTEVAAPFVSALAKADEPMRAQIQNEVFELLRQKFPNGKILIDASALVIYGEK